MASMKVDRSALCNLCQPLRRLRKAEHGAATVELALVAPLVGVMLLGVVDVAQLVAMRFTLEQAANRAVELATARRPMSDADDAFISQEAETAVREVHKDSDLNLVVQPDLYMTCNGVRDDNYASTTCAGATARFAAVTITANYSPMFDYGPLMQLLGLDAAGLSSTQLVAQSEVRLQ